jgi:hypothetical protein
MSTATARLGNRLAAFRLGYVAPPPPMPDTSAIDEAILARLQGDAALLALMPDGVYFDIAAQGKRQFVIVSQLTHEDVDAMTGRPPSIWERPTYLVKAVMVGTSATAVRQAAFRIHELLQGAPQAPAEPLPIVGYALMICHRTERIRYSEIDAETNERWNHRGGHYELWAASAT